MLFTHFIPARESNFKSQIYLKVCPALSIQHYPYNTIHPALFIRRIPKYIRSGPSPQNTGGSRNLPLLTVPYILQYFAYRFSRSSFLLCQMPI